MGCGCTPCSETNSRNGQDGIGISSIIPLVNAFKVVLTDGREYTVTLNLPAAVKGDKGDKGDTGDDGEDATPLTIISYTASPVESGIQVIINFSDETVISFIVPKGTDGSDGSIIFNGVGVPSELLGTSSDYYINIINYDLYKKTSTWGVIGNIKGANGDAGNTIQYVGIIAEAIAGTVIGDTAFEESTLDVYNWNGTTWVFSFNIRGLQGTQGLRGRSQRVYIQDVEPTGGTYYDGDLWILDEDVPAPIPIPPDIVLYNITLSLDAEVEDSYDTVLENNGVLTATISELLPNDLIVVVKVSYLDGVTPLDIIKTVNIRSGFLTGSEPINTGDNGGDDGEPPYLGNPVESVCLQEFHSIADVVIDNYADLVCPV